MNLSDTVQRGWEAVGAGDFDALVTDYVEDMKFVMPRQSLSTYRFVQIQW